MVAWGQEAGFGGSLVETNVKGAKRNFWSDGNVSV